MAFVKLHWLRTTVVFLAVMVASAELGFTSNILTVNVTANDLAYSPVTGLVYAAVPNSAATNPNYLVPINPLTGALGKRIPIGFNPQALVASSDGNNLYAVVGGSLAVQRYNIPSASPDQFFSLSGGARVEQLRAIPDRPNAIMLHRYNTNFNTSEGTVVYENAVALPNRASANFGENRQLPSSRSLNCVSTDDGVCASSIT